MKDAGSNQPSFIYITTEPASIVSSILPAQASYTAEVSEVNLEELNLFFKSMRTQSKDELTLIEFLGDKKSETINQVIPALLQITSLKVISNNDPIEETACPIINELLFSSQAIV